MQARLRTSELGDDPYSLSRLLVPLSNLLHWVREARVFTLGGRGKEKGTGHLVPTWAWVGPDEKGCTVHTSLFPLFPLPSQAIVAVALLVTMVCWGINVRPLLAFGSVSTGERWWGGRAF